MVLWSHCDSKTRVPSDYQNPIRTITLKTRSGVITLDCSDIAYRVAFMWLNMATRNDMEQKFKQQGPSHYPLLHTRWSNKPCDACNVRSAFSCPVLLC